MLWGEVPVAARGDAGVEDPLQVLGGATARAQVVDARGAAGVPQGFVAPRRRTLVVVQGLALLDAEGVRDVDEVWYVAQGRFSYREGVIEPGEEVAVLGWAEREPDPQSGAIGAAYRAPPLRVVLKGRGELPVKVSDDPTTFD